MKLKHRRIIAATLASAILFASATAMDIIHFSNSPRIIGGHSISSIFDANWTQNSTTKINQIMNSTIGQNGLESGKQANFYSVQTNTLLSVNVLIFNNSSNSNQTYIDLTDSMVHGISSNFPINSSKSGGIVYLYFFQPENTTKGSLLNFSSIVAVHGRLFFEIMASGDKIPIEPMLAIVNWEIKHNTK